MATGSSEASTLDAYADAQARLEHAGGYRWRDGVGRRAARARLRRVRARPLAGDLLRRRADPRLARPCARRRSPTCCCSTSPRTTSTSARWSGSRATCATRRGGRAGRPRPLVSRGGRHLGARARGRPGAVLRRARGTPGGPSRPSAELAAGREVERRQAEIARMQRFVERFRYKATKARQAQSTAEADRARAALDATVEADRRRGRSRFRSATPSAPGASCSSSSDAPDRGRRRALLPTTPSSGSSAASTSAWSAPTAPASRPWSRRSPASASSTRAGCSGRPQRRDSATSRQHAEAPAAASVTVLAHAQRSTGLSEARTRALLGRFLFSGEEVEKPLAGISGGEAQRLALAILVSSDSNLLVLDEPTNHLDVESREALEDALRSLRRNGAAGLPRSRPARGRRQPHGRDRGRARCAAIPVGGWSTARSRRPSATPRRRRARRRRAPPRARSDRARTERR